MVLTAPNPVMARIPDAGLPNLLYQRRKSLGLSKRDAARKLGVHCEVIGLWERGERQPRVMYVPAIVDFLDDDGWLSTASFADRLYRFRALKGWTQERLGRWLGCDERTVARWENGHYPSPETRGEIERRFAGTEGQARRNSLTPVASVSHPLSV